MSRYGTVRSPVDIVNAAVQRLKDWQFGYITAINEAYGTDLKPLKYVGPIQDLQRFSDNKYPAALVMVAGSQAAPQKDEHGYYSMPYTMIVGVIAAATSEVDTRRVVSLYGAACRMALGQRRKLAEDVIVQDWAGETIDPLTVREKKRLLLCANSFVVRLDNVFSWKEGPGIGAVPPGAGDPPPADWATITSEPELTILKEPIT